MTGQTITPEQCPQVLQQEVLRRDGTEAMLRLDQEGHSLWLDTEQPVLIGGSQAKLLSLLMSDPNTPYKLSEVRDEIPEFNMPESPNPLEVIKELIVDAPFLAGNIFAYGEGKRQLFGFLPVADDSTRLMQNFHDKLEAERRTPRGNLSQSTKILRVHSRSIAKVSAAILATATSAALVGYVYNRYPNKTIKNN